LEKEKSRGTAECVGGKVGKEKKNYEQLGRKKIRINKKRIVGKGKKMKTLPEELQEREEPEKEKKIFP